MKKEDAYKLGVGQTRFRKKFRRKQRTRKVKSFFGWTICVAAVGAAVFAGGFHVSAATDAGMDGYIDQGDMVLTNKMSYLLREPVRGEVVTCKAFVGGTEHILNRRVIAFPGETVEIHDGSLYINGSICEESYVDIPTPADVESYTVPAGYYYVLCDNRETGPDSRDGIYISRDDIIGSALEGINLLELPSAEDILQQLETNIANVIS